MVSCPLQHRNSWFEFTLEFLFLWITLFPNSCSPARTSQIDIITLTVNNFCSCCSSVTQSTQFYRQTTQNTVNYNSFYLFVNNAMPHSMIQQSCYLRVQSMFNGDSMFTP